MCAGVVACHGCVQVWHYIIWLCAGIVAIRRLSTLSYVQIADENHFGTVWTWKWLKKKEWKTFEKDSAVPLQSVLEIKYLQQQVSGPRNLSK